MLRLIRSMLLPALLLTPAAAQAPATQVFPFTAVGKAAGASGQLSVRTVSAAQSLSVLGLRGLKPSTDYVAHYHALGTGEGGPCASNGSITLGFPAFKTDVRGQATVSLRAASTRLRGPLGAYVNVHTASDLTDIPLCAAVLKTAATPASTASPAITVTVNIADNRFQPATLNVKAGTTVTWVHTGQVTHNVLSVQVADLRSPDLRPGDRYSYTFKTPGSYTYYCSYHEGMSATITVTNR